MIKWCWFLLNFIFLFSCRTISKPVSSREYAVELLNQRKYAEASNIFKQILSQDPDQQNDTKILLASAYIGEAGLDIVAAFSALKPFIFDTNKNTRLAIKNIEGKNVNDPDFIKNYFLNYLEIVTEIVRLTQAFPNIALDNRPKIIEALLLVESVKIDNPYFLRARGLSLMLNFSQTLSYLREVFPTLDHEQMPTFANIICSFEPLIFLGNLEDLLKYSRRSVEDYLFIQESKGKNISKNLDSLNAATEKFNVIIDANRDAVVKTDVVLNNTKKYFCE